MNDLINLFIMVAGLFVFLGITGGICFWIVLFDNLHHYRKTEKEEKKRRCESCQSFAACDELFAGHVPENGCAYFKK